MSRALLLLVLVLPLLNASVKAGDTDIDAQKLAQSAKADRITEDISNWLGQQNYNESRMLFMGFRSKFTQEQLLDVFTTAIEDPSLSTTAWFRLAVYCHQGNHSRLMGNSGLRNDTGKEKLSASQWCQKNQILQRYQKLDPDNAWAYLIELDNTKGQLYNKKNIRLLEKAAKAKFANSYYSQGFNQYSTHLQQYFRLHPDLLEEHDESFRELDLSVSFDITDMASSYVASVAIVGSPSYFPIANICSRGKILEEGFAESIRSNCLKIATKMNTGINTGLDSMMASSIIIKLTEPGSEQHREAVRRKIVEREVMTCVSLWGRESVGKLWVIGQMKIHLNAIPLYAKYSESTAWAMAADAYYRQHYPDLNGKPSDCLFLADMDYDAALKFEQDYKLGVEIR